MNKLCTYPHLLLFTLFLGASAQAGPPSVISGKPMPRGTAHNVAIGWPSLSYEWWHAGDPDWALGGELVYGDWSSEYSNVEIGGAFNIPLRWHMKTGGMTEIAFRLSPGILVASSGGPSDRFAFGTRLELGVPVSISVADRVNIVTGGIIPATLFWVKGTDPFGVVPLLLQFGAEIRATPAIAPYLLFQLGPAIAFGSFGSDVNLGVRVWVGTTFF